MQQIPLSVQGVVVACSVQPVDAMFEASQIKAIAEALGHTTEGLTGSEIGYLIRACGMSDPLPTATKWIRLHDAFAVSQNAAQNRKAILAYIRKAMKPERYAQDPGRYEPMRARLNRALAFCGLVVDETGTLSSTEKARTLAEAENRARALRQDLVTRGVHPDVLSFCRAELVADDYFHAVQEAMKSVASKLQTRTGLTDDGAALVDRALGGELPMLAINQLKTESERSEQRGFVTLIKGAFSMFRNPTAHAARVHWPMGKVDAEDLLSLVSLIHRRLDASHMPPRA